MDKWQQNLLTWANVDTFEENSELSNNIVTIVDVMDEINRDRYKRENFRRYILRLYKYWKKNVPDEKVNDGYLRIWGSKIIFHESKGVNEIFNDNLLINVIDYFITNHVRVVSDITEEVLMKLLFYPNVGYKKFKATIDILFGEKPYEEKSDFDEQEFELKNANETNEVEESLSGGALVENTQITDSDEYKSYNSEDTAILVEKSDDEMIDEMNEVKRSLSDGTLVENPEINEYIHLELFKSEDVERIFKETLWFTSTLQEEIEKRQQSIIDLQTLYLNTKAKAAEQQQIIEEMKLKEMELKETIRRQHESIIEMQDLHEDQLRIKDQEIDSRDRALATKDQDLSHKNMLIASIEANLEIKNEELNLANKELSTKDTLIAERDAELEKRIQELDVTNQELSTKNMLFSEREADLERKIRELDQTNQELIAKDMLLAERNEDLVKKNQDLDIAYQEIIAKNKLLADREMELAVVTQELESLREEKTAEKRSFIEFTKVKETMQNVIKLLRGDNDSELSSEKKEKEIS